MPLKAVRSQKNAKRIGGSGKLLPPGTSKCAQPQSPRAAFDIAVFARYAALVAMLSEEGHERLARIKDAAQRLDRARRHSSPIARLTADDPKLDERDAYAIQAAGVALTGYALAGFKLGYTSEAMRRQMNVPTPNFGRLYTETRIENGGDLDVGQLIHPLVEPEIALSIGCDIEPSTASPEALAAAVDAVFPALEIVDTRYRDYTFSAVDNIADNSSAARFVLGAPHPLRAFADLRSIPATLYADEARLASGVGRDALGDPLHALAWLIGALARQAEVLRAGAIVLTGGLTRAHAITGTSHIRAGFGALGEVALRIS